MSSNPAPERPTRRDWAWTLLAASVLAMVSLTGSVGQETSPDGLDTTQQSSPDDPTGWLVSFSSDYQGREDEMRAAAQGVGATFVLSLQSLPVAYVLATEAGVQELSALEGVVAVEPDQEIEFLDAESREALRMPELTHPTTGLKDANGDPIDGRGVGVAVVDTGIYALHNDLLYDPIWPGGPVVKNWKVVYEPPAVGSFYNLKDMPNTDHTTGHGTHVAGIISGQGKSDADLKGIAPGAKLYGLGVGEANRMIWVAEAFDWILRFHRQADPDIRIVTNSWGSYGPISPTIWALVNLMVDQGIVVVFSAGNEGGDGFTTETTAQCQIPTPGVICVAAHDDLGTGTRNGKIADFSSRGHMDYQDTWPDISAPGVDVRSTRPPVGSVTGFGVFPHVELSGTSMSAPHVAGVAALMLQMDPTLEPHEVQSTMESTAYEFTDGGAYATSGSHYAKGHGLVDAYAAVNAVS